MAPETSGNGRFLYEIQPYGVTSENFCAALGKKQIRELGLQVGKLIRLMRASKMIKVLVPKIEEVLRGGPASAE